LATLTGYALYYLVNEAWRPATGWAHAALGLVVVIVGVWHARKARARQGAKSDTNHDLAQEPPRSSGYAFNRNERESHLDSTGCAP
jgi:uncharacterized membrane protein